MSVRRLSLCAVTAALYVVLTYALSFMAYGPIQFRVAEALTILPFFGSYGIAALTVGCFISNLLSPYGLLDMILGTLATFIGAFGTYMLSRSKKDLWFLAPLPPILSNMALIGLLITIQTGVFKAEVFLLSALEVGAGEFVCCYGLGLPLLLLIRGNKRFIKFFTY